MIRQHTQLCWFSREMIIFAATHFDSDCMMTRHVFVQQLFYRNMRALYIGSIQEGRSSVSPPHHPPFLVLTPTLEPSKCSAPG